MKLGMLIYPSYNKICSKNHSITDSKYHEKELQC